MMRFLLPNFAPMETDFQYSTDFYGMNAPQLSHTCMHLLCTAGEGSFVFNEHCYHIMKNDLVVIPMPNRVSNLAAHPNMQVEWFAADYKFLQNLLPSNNYSIGGSISLNQDPVVPLTDEQAGHLLDSFHRLRDRMVDRHMQFYSELMGSLCLSMMYDIFEVHALRDATDTHTDRTAYIVKQLMALLATGISRTERDVSYYAERLNVSPKYLSATIKRVTGHSVTSYIDRHTVPILKDYLDDERLSLTQIAEQMNFTSLSYFSRYCTKHLGQSPSRYRQSLQPKFG
jgi:AraC-like DNA-binding protein